MEENEISLFRKILSFLAGLLPPYRPGIFHSLQGEWQYECIVAEGKDFPYPKGSGNSHGGTITVSIKRKGIYTYVRVQGTRIWQFIRDENGNLVKENLKNPIDWRAFEGSFISNTRIMYKYTIPHESIIGVTFLNLTYDKQKKQFTKPPEGEFYYIPDSSIKLESPYDLVKTSQRRKGFGKIWGTVKYSNYQKRKF